MTRKIAVITGSPRPQGVTRRYADLLEEHLRTRDSSEDIEIVRWDVWRHKIMGCIGCERCRDTFTCIIPDDAYSFYDVLDTCDELHVVCPVYYASVPSQFKAVLDRVQPYWERRIGPCSLRVLPRDVVPKRCDTEKRNLEIYVVGAGGDPYGFEPLVITIQSALGSAGFKLSAVHDVVGWGQTQKEDFRA